MSTKANVNLTIPRIEKFKCEPGKAQAFLWDAEVKGLGVRATPSGSKAFIFQSRVNGSCCRVVIGDVKAWRLDVPAGCGEPSARKEARRLQTLCDQGIDPREQKAAKKQEAEQRKIAAMRESVTVGELWPRYMVSNPTWRPRTIEAMEKAALAPGLTRQRGGKPRTPGALYALFDVPLRELDAAKLEEWLQQESAIRPAAARLAFRFLRGFASWCEEQDDTKGLVDILAFGMNRVRKHVAKAKVRHDCLQREMLAAWFKAIRQCPNVTASAFLQTLLLTGARKEEIARLRWEHISFEWRYIHIVQDKTSEDGRFVPLPPYLCALLQSLPRINGFVFASKQSSTGRIRDARARMQEAIQMAGLPHVTIHGLRRSFSVLADWTECPAGVTRQIQGHAAVGASEINYKPRPLDMLRLWHDRIEKFILTEAGIQQPEAGTAAPGLRVVA
ncbi:tyrosine-type recombinase/integrase [Crenobacter intestini]|nr:tyrosine-type recombinase/integrase [Crenobacter intestini]